MMTLLYAFIVPMLPTRAGGMDIVNVNHPGNGAPLMCHFCQMAIVREIKEEASYFFPSNSFVFYSYVFYCSLSNDCVMT